MKTVVLNSNTNKKSKEKKENKKENKNIIMKNNTNNFINNNIINDNNISNIKSANDDGIEDDLEELFGNKKQKDLLFDKMAKNKKIEEMNPTFLNDIKTNNAFEAEQELLKLIKKENKDISNKSNNGELSKEDIEMDLNNSHFNFDYQFFVQQQQENNEENEYNGNYEDFKFKSLIDNLNNIENLFNNEEQKGKLDSLLNNNNNININYSNKEESECKEEEYEKEDSFKVNEYEQYLINKNKFDNNFNYYDYVANYDNQNDEDKKFHNKFDEYQKTFGKNWKK